MKLEILVPQYNETEEIIKPLLDSIALQQNVDLKNEVGVIITNDGSDTKLSQEFLNSYPFKITYLEGPHRGVSASRNNCLDHATADYVMFCDADDMFYNMCGIYMILKEIETSNFDTLVSVFIEETKINNSSNTTYINRQMDSTFVHGKVHKRQYLVDNNIRWNDNLTIHEDSYFNILCQKLTDNGRYCPTPFYLWKWRDNSVCRHDPKYILKTYNNMIDSVEALTEEFLRRGKRQLAQFYAFDIVYDAYFAMNKEEWINQENKEFRDKTELRFKDFYIKYQKLISDIPLSTKTQIIAGIKNRMFQEGLLMETITFDDWIKHILEL